MVSVNSAGIPASYNDYRLSQLNNASRELDVTNERLETGKYHSNLLDKPKVYHAVSQYNVSIADSKQNIESIKTNTKSLENNSFALQQVSEIITQAKVAGLAGVDAGNDPITMTKLSYDVQSLKDRLLRVANTQDSDGNYIFGDFKNDQVPFTVNGSGALDFNGKDYDNNQKSVWIGAEELKIDFPPNAFFRDLYDTLDKLSINLGNQSVDGITTYSVQDPNDPTKKISVPGNLEKLKDSFNANLLNKGSVDRMVKELDSRSKIEVNRVSQMQENISQLTDITYQQAITEKSQKQMVYDHLLQAQTDMFINNHHNMGTISRLIATAA